VNLTVHRNELDAASAAADLVAAAVRARPTLVIGLSAGRATLALYRQLAARHGRDRLDLSATTAFALEEFWPLAPDHPGSCRAHMERHLFVHVDIPRARVHLLDGMASDARAECLGFERALATAGGLDLLVIGIGANGHLGFNEPAGTLQARTHLCQLRPQTRRAHASFFGSDAQAVPQAALSVGMATLLRARRIVAVASGRAKGRAVERMINGPLTTRLPASFLQLPAHVDVVLDEAAAEPFNDTQRLHR
jgi:glucosamine-6-phosphate deaminase